jgi:hypothetical protein
VEVPLCNGDSSTDAAGYLLFSADCATLARMSLRCLFNLHRPMLTSIVARTNGFAALCGGCGLPIERSEEGRWTVSQPLATRQDKAV